MKYDRQIQRVRHMPQLTERSKEYVIFLIEELHSLFADGRFSVFPTHDYSRIILRWDKMANAENVAVSDASSNNFMELVVDPKQGSIIDFHLSLVEPVCNNPSPIHPEGMTNV